MLPPDVSTVARQRLLEALAARDLRYGNRHATFLGGAFAVLEQDANEDRIAQSAHSMRELFEKLPKQYEGAPKHATLGDVNALLDKVLTAHEKARSASGAYQVGTKKWEDSVDPPLAGLLKVIGDVAERRRIAVSSADRRSAFLSELDPLGGELPPYVKEKVGKQWRDHEDYFNAVSHHGKVPTMEEYRDRIDAAIRFLADQLRPPVLETLAQLDELIERAESDG